MDLLGCWMRASARASAMSWAHLCASSCKDSEFSKIHIYCMNYSGDESVFASLVKVSFVK